MKECNVPGVSIALIRNNEIAFTKNFGVKDTRTSSPVTGETMFEACSMSKPVFAYIVFKLVEQKNFDLDTPLNNYLSEEFVSEDDEYSNIVTARMILSHTGGFPNWRKGEEEREGPLPIYFTPGERFSYSGEGYFYLQRVVEKITGKSLEENAKELLFQPSGLNHSSFIWSAKIDSLISCGHDTSGNFLAKSKYLHPNSAYTLYITAEDYARFIVKILKSNEASDNSSSRIFIEEMLKPQVDVLVRDPIERPGRSLGLFTYWGLGWAIDSTASGKIYYHSGANRTGFRCYSQFRIDDGSGIVIMTNGLNGSELWTRLIKEIGDF
jgi:CubicO group peptidase (beta-lactamase class C family)